MFDIGFGELLVLAVLGLFVFGPEKLPKLIGDTTRTLRNLRRMAQGAQRELTESLDLDLKGIDLQSLDPRTFVKRTLLDDVDLDLDALSDRERLQRGSQNGRSTAGRGGSRSARSGAGSRPVAPPTGDEAVATEGAELPAAAPVVHRPAPWDDDTT